jgi:hypothetical protein
MSARLNAIAVNVITTITFTVILTFNIIFAAIVQISADHIGEEVSRSRFPSPLASVSYPCSDDVIDSRYTVIGITAAVLCVTQ